MGKEEPLYNDKEYKTVKTIKDEHYGECKLLESKETGKLLVDIEKNFQKPEELELMTRNALLRKENPSKFIVPLINFTTTNKSGLCSKTYRINLLNDFCRNNLAREI